MENQPTKERIRAWLQQRWLKHEPPPEMDQIRRQLGWTQPKSAQDAMAEEHKQAVAA